MILYTRYHVSRIFYLLNFCRASAGRKGAKASADNSKKTPTTNSAELASRRRYLESPFFCLCQSSTATYSHACSTLDVDTITNSSSNSMPAHVINPALKDCVNAGDPINCPVVQAAIAGGKKKPAVSSGVLSVSAPLSELASFFANSLYKPTLRGPVRDTRLPATYSDSACGSFWCCVFCGERSDFLLLGPLYGPYFLTKDTSSHPSPDTAKVSSSTSSEVANTGGLRLVIKAISPPANGTVKLNKKGNAIFRGSGRRRRATNLNDDPVAKSPPVVQQEHQETRGRIGEGGEIWLHLECLLWAPGTAIQGDGVINGLDDAVSMALDVVSAFPWT